MAHNIHLRVVTPQATVFDGEVSDCSAPGAEGEFGVLPEHISYLTAVVPGPLSFTGGGSGQRFAIGRGFIQVAGDHVTVLCRYADPVASLTKADVEQQLKDAETAFAELGPQDAGYDGAMERVQDARGRLAALSA